MKASDKYPVNLLREKFPKKEVKMSEQNPEENQPTNEGKETSPREVIQELLTNSLKPLSDRMEQLEGKIGEFIEHTNPLDEGEIEQKGFERGLEGLASGFENNELIGELEPIAQRIFQAIQSQGYDIVPQEKPAEEVEEAETEEIETELPEAPYLHIISLEDREKLPEEERRKYFGWGDGKVAKMVEAV